jgi:hypothetical protein
MAKTDANTSFYSRFRLLKTLLLAVGMIALRYRDSFWPYVSCIVSIFFREKKDRQTIFIQTLSNVGRTCIYRFSLLWWNKNVWKNIGINNYSSISLTTVLKWSLFHPCIISEKYCCLPWDLKRQKEKLTWINEQHHVLNIHRDL